MSDEKERKDNGDEQNENKHEEVQKDLEDILGRLKESDDPEKSGTSKEKERKEPEDVFKPQAAKSAPESEPEEIEDILEKISEKEEEPVEEVPPFERVMGVFTSPGRVFRHLRVRPEYMIPLIITIIISIVTSLLVYDIALDDQVAQYERSEKFTPEQKDMIIDNLEASRSGPRRILYTFVVPVITVLIMFSLVSAIFLFIGNILLGGKARFKQVFSAYAYAYLIIAIAGTIVKLPLWLNQHTLKVDTSLAVFLPTASEGSAIYRFLSSFDVFTLWFLVVFGIGYAIIYRFSQLKGIVSVFTAWLVYVLLAKVLLGGFLAGFTG